MATWTVITITGTSPDHIGAVAGRHTAYGHNVHTAYVTARTADEAIEWTRDAFRTIGPHLITADTSTPPHADRWTVVGLASNGPCATHTVDAVLPGEHEVQGRRESMLSHRWTRVVDAATADDAEKAGYRNAADDYNATWD
ncbi:hypothetical protein ACFYUR_19255 [Micromonospora haikouensis]|uniref:hypothetical protein n=1 Tax=Micromonospora haikouensis TaxID=686309 RepID=UPI0036772A4A